MYSVYVIVSERGDRYIGFTGMDPYTRLEGHNAGDTRSTRDTWPRVAVDVLRSVHQ